MKAYGHLPQEKAMGALIHDHAGASAGIGHAVSYAKMALEKGDTEKVFRMLELIEKSRKRGNEALDAYYEQFKDDFAL